MAARPRANGRKEWPTGLNETRPGYFMWFNPITKTYVKIGRIPLAEARMQSMEANLWAAGQMGKARLLDRLQEQGKIVRDWLEEWIATLEHAPDTIRNYRVRAKAVSAEIGDCALARLTVKEVAEALDRIRKTRGDSTAQGCRSVMKGAFNEAISKGLMTMNPADVTKNKKPTVKRKRLTMEDFAKVRESLKDAQPWLQHAVLLGMITGQRREDLAALKFSDVADDHLLVTPIKNQGTVKIAIPLALYSKAMGMSLKDAIAECRRTGVVSKFMVHQTRPIGRSAPGQPISLNTITSAFKEHVVKALGPGENLPSLHELRSLCKRTYIEQGGVDTRALLGHTSDSSEALYANSRGAEFQKVKIG